MICKHCGAEMDDAMAICPACGAPVDTVETEVTGTEPSILGAVPASELMEEPMAAEDTLEEQAVETERPSEETIEGEETGDAQEYHYGAAVAQQQAQGEYDPWGAQSAAPRKKGSVLPLVISLLLVAGLAVGAYFLFFANSDPASAEKALKNEFSNVIDKYNADLLTGDTDKIYSNFSAEARTEDNIEILTGSVQNVIDAASGGQIYGLGEIDVSNQSDVLSKVYGLLKLKLALIDVQLSEDKQTATGRVVTVVTFQMPSQSEEPAEATDIQEFDQAQTSKFSFVKDKNGWLISALREQPALTQ